MHFTFTSTTYLYLFFQFSHLARQDQRYCSPFSCMAYISILFLFSIRHFSTFLIFSFLFLFHISFPFHNRKAQTAAVEAAFLHFLPSICDLCDWSRREKMMMSVYDWLADNSIRKILQQWGFGHLPHSNGTRYHSYYCFSFWQTKWLCDYDHHLDVRCQHKQLHHHQLSLLIVLMHLVTRYGKSNQTKKHDQAIWLSCAMKSF